MTKLQYVGKAFAWFIYLTVTMFWLIPAFGQTPSTALRFTADGHQVLVPHTDELDRISLGLTIESWVRPDASILSRGYSSIVSKQMNGTGYMTASNLVGPEPGFKAEVAGIQVTSQSRPVAGVWQHVAAVWDGQLKIYANGQLNGMINTGPPIPNTFPLWIGSSPFGAETNFRGDIDEVRVWAVARSQGQIQSTMNQYLCGDEDGLRAYWSFDEGSGQQLKDTLGRSNGSISGPQWVPGVQLSRRPCPPVSFVGIPPKTFPAGTDPRASVGGDFNRDGNKDLAMANSGSNDVSVLLGNGDGTFRPPVNFLVGGSPNSIVMDYFNGDSFQDLAVANSNSISVLLGNGNGTFQPALNFPAGPGASSIERGDFNLDHRMDLIVRTNAGFAVHLGNGNGTFRAPLDTPAGPYGYVAGYFNDDGILDVANASGQSGVLVRFGNGDGTFQEPVGVVGWASVTFAVGLLSGDGRPDIAVGGCETRPADICVDVVSVLINNTP
jgi:Concanavalin A-like lectin/glucanases superfamily/FG-GAP-like repeat